jgi:uncharacterized membrane protein
MFDAAYRRRLASDLPRWREAGWVGNDGAEAILASVTGRRATFSLAATVATLGALLVGIGVIAFVAAHWEEMSRPVRLGVIVAGLAVAYLAAAILDRRRLRIFAEAALLAAALVFAAAIAFVGQAYSLSIDFADAILRFEVGVFAAALLVRSPTMTVIGLIGAGYWAWFGTVGSAIVPHWPSLAAVVVGAALAAFQSARIPRIFVALALLVWAALTIVGFAIRDDWSFAAATALAAVAALAIWALGAALAARAPWPRLAALGEAWLPLALIAVLVAFGVEQFLAVDVESTAVSELRSVGEPQPITAAVVIAGIGVALALVAVKRLTIDVANVVAVAALAAAAILFALYLPESILVARLAGGVIVVVAALWAVYLGQAAGYPFAKTLGLIAFGLEVIYLYAVTLGTLIETAFAFIGGGVLFVALAWGLYRIDRRLARVSAERDEEQPQTPAASAGGSS